MKVRPARSNYIIRDPLTRVPLPHGGKNVPNNSFWRRRIKAGDVIEVKDLPPVAPPPPPPPPPVAKASESSEAGDTRSVEPAVKPKTKKHQGHKSK